MTTTFPTSVQTFTAPAATDSQNSVPAVAHHTLHDTIADTLEAAQTKILRDIRSAADFGAIGDGTVGTADMLTAITAAWDSALANGHDLYFPPGTYEIGDVNMPWRQAVFSGSLQDCGNVTVHGAGPSTIFKTNSPDGADVFQLNGVKNLHFRNFKITATLTGSAGSGSNGISITNGYDNISVLDVWIEDCPSIDATSFVDGGKALSVQCSTATAEVGSLTARIFAKRCSFGFDFAGDLDAFLAKKVAIDIDIVAEDCYIAVGVGAGEASAAVTAGAHSGIRIKATAINCQRDVSIARAHGLEVECVVVTTKTAAARRLDAAGVAWIASDTVIEAMKCAYAKNSRITVVGHKGECDYKARIGGATAGSSGLTATTQHCHIVMDIGGTAATANVGEVNSGGNYTKDCHISATTTTLTSWPTEMAKTASNNLLTLGPISRLVNPVVAGSISLATGTDGVTEFGRIALFGSITGLKGAATSGANAVVTGLYDQGGTLRIGCVNGNGLVVDALPTTAAIGAYVAKLPVWSSGGVLLGYIPVYG